MNPDIFSRSVTFELDSVTTVSSHTKVKCSKPLCTDISESKIIEKHPEHKAKISQLQREIRSLENKAQEEETHLKSFRAVRERIKSSFFCYET